MGFAGLVTGQGWLWRIDGVFYDAAMVTRRIPADPDVVVVAIDDRSLAEIGRWPWRRAVHAALLERLKALGAQVVAMDVMFHEPAPEESAGDAALARAIAAHGRVVLPVTHATHAARSDGEALPAPMFAEAAAALGHIHIELDPDGIARSVYLWEGMNAPRYPQLALAALSLAAPQLALRYPEPPPIDAPGWRRESAGDAALARAIAAHGRVVLPVTHATHAARSDGEALPAPMFAEAAAALGHIHIELDPDGIARSVYLWEGMNAPRYPQLALAALSLAAPQLALRYPEPPPIDAPGWRRADWMRIPFAGPPGTYRYISYVDVLRGALADGALRGAVVFVGASAVGMGDIVPTPTSGHARPMPGVELHATVFSALRRGDAIHSLPNALDGALASLLLGGLMLVMLRSGPRLALLAAFGFALGALAAAWVALLAWQTWVPPAGAVLACLLAYPLWSWRRLEATQHYLDNELAALRETGEHLAMILPSAAAAPALDRFGARIAVVRDAARRQRDLQRFISDALDGLPVGAVVIDHTGQVRLVNRRATELLGVSEPWALRATLGAMPWPEAGAPLERVATDRAVAPQQIEVELDNGRVVLASLAGLFDETGQPLGAVVGLADISALHEAQRSREDTMHFLSHDMRAPLASILTLVGAARGAVTAPPPGSPEAERLGWVERYARAALTLADDLFRLVRAEGVDPASFSELSLDMLVQDAADQVWALARAKGVTLATDIALADDDALRRVRGDGDLLCRAIVNLLTNAVKYTPQGGRITLSLAACPSGWAVTVGDTGIGIPPEQQMRLFQRFSRLNTAENRRLSGVGLGLLMVRTVAERHGGSVSVSSRPGEGSVFTLSLPAA
nr:CHASE2 and HATPase_c domain-containing protein [Aromatoleum diolicum]